MIKAVPEIRRQRHKRNIDRHRISRVQLPPSIPGRARVPDAGVV